MSNQKELICKNSVSLKNLLTIDSYLEFKGVSSASSLIFVSMYESYNSTKPITILFDDFELNKLKVALQELLQTRESEYVKYSDSGKSDKTSSNKQNRLYLAYEQSLKNLKKKEFYYLNFQRKNEDDLKVSLTMDKYDVRALIDLLKHILHQSRTYIASKQRMIALNRNGEL